MKTTTLLLLVASLAASGCYVESPYLYGYEIEYVDGVPADIDAYPHVYYQGGWAYLIDDHWYYYYDGHWIVFEREPHVLWRYRMEGSYDHHHHHHAHPHP